MHIYPSIWGAVWACDSSQGEISLCQRAWTTDLLCLFIKDMLLASFSFLCPSVETLSVCLNEKSTNVQLHTAALQFLCSVLKEETKNRGVAITTLNCNPAPALCDIVRGPSAGQLCELLLQVCRAYLNYLYPFVLWNKHDHCFILISEFWEADLSGLYKEVSIKSSDDLASLQPCSSKPRH